MTIMFSKLEASDWVLLGFTALGAIWIRNAACNSEYIPDIVKGTIMCSEGKPAALQASELKPGP